ncbi:hypothetical protein [Nocardioides bruguierae]|uniref:hypothetical protein n=1 Tax=Nocardioides bruguierae TaxID=2945102 RepID=UPI0020211C34|nr:hypothetical protein [Nocardioides bruguierae]MCL8025009.1 hypothetical protein [Nocardioides bruguierae]
MSETSTTSDSTASTGSDLGPMPQPEATRPQLVPGGPDAVLEAQRSPVVPDVAAEANPATAATPEANRSGEDTSTQATRGEKAPAAPESPA